MQWPTSGWSEDSSVLSLTSHPQCFLVLFLPNHTANSAHTRAEAVINFIKQRSKEAACHWCCRINVRHAAHSWLNGKTYKMTPEKEKKGSPIMEEQFRQYTHSSKLTLNLLQNDWSPRSMNRQWQHYIKKPSRQIGRPMLVLPTRSRWNGQKASEAWKVLISSKEDLDRTRAIFKATLSQSPLH